VTERILLVLALVLIAAVAWRLISRRAIRRKPGIVEGLWPGRPAILYFTTPGCAPCETIQRPALDELRERYDGGLQIVEIDASAQPRLADAWGVLTVPTVFVIDAAGRPRRVHHGPVRADVLARQLEEVGGLRDQVARNPG
jgi:thioredoxin-like negative regulator of GroEL